MLARLACRRPFLALRPATALRRLSLAGTPPRPDSRITWAAYDESRVRTAATPASLDAADDDAAPTITTAALEATASDPASDPVLSARLEDYILTWADPGVITPSFLATKWLRSLRRDIRRDLPTWLGTTGAVPEARPPAPKARGAWADDADRTPQPPARKPGGKPELMDPDRLLSCLTRLADYGKLGDPNAPLRVAIERTFKVRAMANPNPVVLTLAQPCDPNPRPSPVALTQPLPSPCDPNPHPYPNSHPNPHPHPYQERAMAPGGAAAPQGLLRSTRAIERANWRDGAEGPHPDARPAQRRHVAEELPADADAYRAGGHDKWQDRRRGGGGGGVYGGGGGGGGGGDRGGGSGGGGGGGGGRDPNPSRQPKGLPKGYTFIDLDEGGGRGNRGGERGQKRRDAPADNNRAWGRGGEGGGEGGGGRGGEGGREAYGAGGYDAGGGGAGGGVHGTFAYRGHRSSSSRQPFGRQRAPAAERALGSLFGRGDDDGSVGVGGGGGGGGGGERGRDRGDRSGGGERRGGGGGAAARVAGRSRYGGDARSDRGGGDGGRGGGGAGRRRPRSDGGGTRGDFLNLERD